ncbi:peptidyl-prolyl cis-trans isomerase A [Pavlovales sp. CCMP2436]|nr:peptidyl-prolyl cis-trans isomerase A [Pavlovales sp. CCMP2436]
MHIISRLGNGMGGRTADGKVLKDENFFLKHDAAGVLSMANRGPNTATSQFFMTFDRTPWLDGKHVVFGKVVEGQAVLNTLEAVGSRSGATTKRVMVVKTGML